MQETYGVDTKKRLPELLHRICDIQGKFGVRLGMMNPEFALEIIHELIDCYGSEKVLQIFALATAERR